MAQTNKRIAKKQAKQTVLNQKKEPMTKPESAETTNETQGVSLEELETVTEQRDDYLHHLQRLQAEFDNFRKRTQRERLEMKEFLLQDLFSKLLDVIENMERALHPDNQTDNLESYRDGVEMVFKRMMSVLSDYGLTRIETEGAFFDPTMHEAIAQIESKEHESGTIVNEFSAGYMLKERVLKAPRVQVAK